MSERICVSNQDNSRIVVGVERKSFDLLLMAGAIEPGWGECEVAKKDKGSAGSDASTEPAPESKPARKPRKVKSTPRPCPVKRCTQPGKGPRFGFHCEKHKDQFVAKGK